MDITQWGETGEDKWNFFFGRGDPRWAILWILSTIYKEGLFYFTLWSNVVLKQCSQRKEWHMEMCGGERLREENRSAPSNQDLDTHLMSEFTPENAHTSGTNTLNILNSIFKFQPNSSRPNFLVWWSGDDYTTGTGNDLPKWCLHLDIQ